MRNLRTTRMEAFLLNAPKNIMIKKNNAPLLVGIVMLFVAMSWNALGQTPDQANAASMKHAVSEAQSSSSSFAFRPGQSIYIVAFRRVQPYSLEAVNPVERQEYSDFDLDAERKVRKRIETWTYFSVVDKLSQADFVFLVNLDQSSIEGLAIPVNAYQVHFKDKFDLDTLRESAYGRYLIGPLKLPSLSRLSDRLVEQFRDKAGAGKTR